MLDVLVQTRRNKRAALKLMRKLLKKYGFVPDKLVTDDLRSYWAAAGHLGIERRHERGRWRNNRAENSSTDPTKGEEDARVQERGIRGFVAWILVSEDCPVQRISGDAHADWTSEFQHSVKRLDRDFDLTHATCIFT